MNLLLKNGCVLTDGALRRADIAIKDGKIAAIGTIDGDGIDLHRQTVTAGYIDTHIHGGGGHSACGGQESLEVMSRLLAQHGVTGFLPTLAAETLETTGSALESIARAMETTMPGAAVLGAHMEGPFIGRNLPGALNMDNFLAPTLDNWKRLTDGYSHVVRRMTLDPELPGAIEMIDHLTGLGIAVSLGHSTVSYERALCAFEHGAKTATHLYNAMPAMHHRAPGLLGAALTCPDAYVELIADLVHVHPAALKVAIQTKGAQRVLFVSDAMEAAGMADGRYDLGGLVVNVVDGVARIPAGNLAGSTLFLDRAVRNAVEHLGVPLYDAASMAAATPADVIAQGDCRGTIAVGYAADLAVLDEQLCPVMTIVKGRVVYQKES